MHRAGGSPLPLGPEHPGQEAANSQVTAAKAGELHTQVATAQTQTEQARMSLETQLAARDSRARRSWG